MSEPTGMVRVRPVSGSVVISLSAHGGPIAAALSPAQAMTVAKALIESATAIRGDAEAAEMKARSEAREKAARLRDEAAELDGMLL